MLCASSMHYCALLCVMLSCGRPHFTTTLHRIDFVTLSAHCKIPCMQEAALMRARLCGVALDPIVTWDPPGSHFHMQSESGGRP